MVRKVALAAGAVALFCAMSASAQAGLKMCNDTTNQVAVAIGYKDKEGWASEGWWTIDARKCVTLIKIDLIARYYYIYAIDKDKGGSWGGKAMMCMNVKEFTIRGIAECTGPGDQKIGFFEVDTGEETDWTVSLSGEKTTPGQGQ